MATFHFDLVSPEKLLFSGDVDQVDVPGSEGDFGVLAGHAPFVTTVRPGIVTIFREGGALKVVVNGGFAEVNPQGLTVLADMAVPLDDFDRSVLASQIKEVPHQTLGLLVDCTVLHHEPHAAQGRNVFCRIAFDCD